MSIAFKQVAIRAETIYLPCQPKCNNGLFHLDSKLQVYSEDFQVPTGAEATQGTQQNKWFEANKNINPQPFPSLHSHCIYLPYAKFAFVEIRLTNLSPPVLFFCLIF